MFNRPGRQALMEYIELNHKIQREKKVFVQFVLGLFYQYLTSAYPPNRLLPGLGTCSHLSPNHQLTRCSLTILTDGLPQMGLIANKTTTTNKEEILRTIFFRLVFCLGPSPLTSSHSPKGQTILTDGLPRMELIVKIIIILTITVIIITLPFTIIATTPFNKK